MSLSVRGVLIIRVVQRRRSLELVLVSVNHLMVNDFLNNEPVRNQSYSEPWPDHTFLSKMLRVESFWLEVQVLALVVPLVSNIVPNLLVVRL